MSKQDHWEENPSSLF